MSVCVSVYLSLCLGYKFWLIWHRNFIFDMVLHPDHLEIKVIRSNYKCLAFYWQAGRGPSTERHSGTACGIIRNINETSSQSVQSVLLKPIMVLRVVQLGNLPGEVHCISNFNLRKSCNRTEFLWPTLNIVGRSTNNFDLRKMEIKCWKAPMYFFYYSYFIWEITRRIQTTFVKI